MNRIIPLFLLFISVFASCERDFFEDYECINRGGADIGGWKDEDTTDVVEKKDTTGGFYIELDNWGDTIVHNIEL